MQVSDVSWQVSAQLRRLNSMLLAEVVEAKLRQLERAVKANFDPNQPRVPAGSAGGGQWTGAGTSESAAGSLTQSTTEGSTTVERIIALARRITTAGSPLDYQRCLDLCYPLLERPQHPASDRNEWDFYKCMNACLQLNF